MEENNKEINLLQLITLLFNWFKNVFISIFRFLGSLIKLCFRQKLIVLAITLISISAGQYMARQSAQSFKAEAMAMIYGSDAQTVKEICKQLENSSSSNKLISLVTKLSLPDSVVKNIVGIQSFYVIDYLKDGVADKIDFDNNHSLSDTLNLRMRDRLYLQVKTRKIAQIGQVQNALLNYFNNNELLKTHLDSKKEELNQQIQICNTEMQRIDSLAKVSYFNDTNKQMQFENNKLLLGEQQKQLFYNDLLQLQRLKSGAERQLSEIKLPVQLPSGFVVDPSPLNGRAKYGIISLLIGLVLSVIVSGLIENAHIILKFLNKK